MTTHPRPTPPHLHIGPDDAQPSPEAVDAVHRSTEALQRATQMADVEVPRVRRRERELTMSNHFVQTFRQALGITS